MQSNTTTGDIWIIAVHCDKEWSSSKALTNTALHEKLSSPQPDRKFPCFMEAEGSLPFAQRPATFLYPKPDKSTLRCPIIFV